MIGITSTAVSHIVKRRDERGASRSSSARLTPSSNGIWLSYGDSPEPGDRKIDTSDIEVYVARDLASRLEGRVIDVRETDNGYAWVVKRPAGQNQQM
jgi:hypothetical protein